MIWIDKNEDATSNIPSKLKAIGLPVIIASPPPNQPQFDYVINDTVGIERKEVADYFQSKQSGHLDTQLYNLSTNFSLSFLVIIGNIQNYLIENGIPRQTFYGSYLGTQIKQSPDGKQGFIAVNEVPTDDDFILWLKTLHDKFDEGNFTRLPKFVKNISSSQDIAVANLCTFPNIGPVKAKAILKQHKTLGNAYMVLACAPTLGVKGINEKTEHEMRKILSQEYGE